MYCHILCMRQANKWLAVIFADAGKSKQGEACSAAERDRKGRCRQHPLCCSPQVLEYIGAVIELHTGEGTGFYRLCCDVFLLRRRNYSPAVKKAGV